MTRFSARTLTLAAALAVVPLLSCTSTSTKSDDDLDTGPVADARTAPLMQRKLAHSHAILDALPGRRYDIIKRNAQALVNLSQESDFHVLETVAYVTLSSRFRDAAAALAERAAAEDIRGASDAYADVIRECVACHDYLRAEGLLRDAPGKVTDAGTGEDFVTTALADLSARASR
jgi:cytochrome c556